MLFCFLKRIDVGLCVRMQKLVGIIALLIFFAQTFGQHYGNFEIFFCIGRSFSPANMVFSLTHAPPYTRMSAYERIHAGTGAHMRVHVRACMCAYAYI